MAAHADWHGIVFDSSDPSRLGRFWADALGYTIEDDSTGWVALRDPDHRLPGLAIQGINQEVQHGSTTSEGNRAHLDIGPPMNGHTPADRVEAEVSRLELLGARRLHPVFQPDDDTSARPTHWLMADPEGNVFCVT